MKCLTMLFGSFVVTALCSFAGHAAVLPDAVYIVPASTDGQIPETRFPGVGAEFGVGANGEATITFRLPEDLVGPGSAPLFLIEKADVIPGARTFFGAGNSANCTTSDSINFVCKLSYGPRYSSSFNPAAAAAFLNQRYAASPDLLAQKLLVSASFIHDPEGILQFSK